MTAFTQGPWDAWLEEECGYEPQIVGGNRLPVCKMYQIYGVPKKEMEANAHLMAAAPEMYAALRLCWDAIRVYGPDYMHGMPRERYVEIAEAALAKERGEDA